MPVIGGRSRVLDKFCHDYGQNLSLDEGFSVISQR
jgi:hypothetical protein